MQVRPSLTETFQQAYQEAQVTAKEKSDPFKSLSPRQEELLELVVAGASNKAIGEKLNIAENTVRNHVAAIFAKLKVNNRTEASFLYHKRKMASLGVSGDSKKTDFTNPIKPVEKKIDHVSGISEFLKQKYGAGQSK